MGSSFLIVCIRHTFSQTLGLWITSWRLALVLPFSGFRDRKFLWDWNRAENP